MSGFFDFIYKKSVTDDQIEGLKGTLALMNVRTRALIDEATRFRGELPGECFSLMSDLKYYPEDATRKIAQCEQCLKEHQYKDAKGYYDTAHREVWDVAKKCKRLTDIIRRLQRK